MVENEIYRKGVELAEKLFGDKYGEFKDIPLSESDDLPKELVTWLYGYLMQERSVIPLRLRLLTAISMLTCLEREEMLAQWIKAALNWGLKKEEIREVVITDAIMAGWPVTHKGLSVFQKVVDQFEESKACKKQYLKTGGKKEG